MKDKATQNLLVEGNDDFHVIASLCKSFNVIESFDINDCKGIDNLINSLSVRLKSSGVQTIGVVIDADADVNSRWSTIKDILISSSLYNNIPDTIPLEGLILYPTKKDDIKFGLWIMPNNQTNGMLEDFTAFLIPEDDKLLPITDSILKDIEDKSLNEYKSSYHAKARIHTWLAWQKEPGTPMGLAITKKYLTTIPPICQTFVDWLDKLFN